MFIRKEVFSRPFKSWLKAQSAPIWSWLQFEPQSFEAPAPALIKKIEPKSSSSSSETVFLAEKLQLQLRDKKYGAKKLQL